MWSQMKNCYLHCDMLLTGTFDPVFTIDDYSFFELNTSLQLRMCPVLFYFNVFDTNSHANQL